MRGAASSVSAINKRRLMLLAMIVTNLPYSGDTLFTTPDGRAVNNTRRNVIFVENNDFFHIPAVFDPQSRGPRRNIVILFGIEN